VKDFWLKQAGLIRRRYNTACWLSAWLPIFVVFCCLAAVVLLWCRQAGASLPFFWWGFIALSPVPAIWAYCLSRAKFLTLEEALVRIETAEHLDARLSSAHAGAGEFPAREHSVSDGSSWEVSKIAFPLGTAICLLLCAQLFPVRPANSMVSSPGNRPHSLAETEDLLAELEKSEVVSPEDLEDLKEQLEQLEELDPDERFEENGLEAADSLKERVEQGAAELLSGIERLEDQLDSLEGAEQLPQASQEELQSSLGETLRSLEQGSMRLSPELSKSLSESLRVDPGSLSPEQLNKLKQRLQQGREKLAEALGDPSGSSEQGSELGTEQGEQQGGDSQGQCSGGSSGGEMCENGSQGQGAGKNGKGGKEGGQEEGGIGKGGDTAPLVLNEKSPKITSNAQQMLDPQGRELELGKFLGEQLRAPNSDTSGDYSPEQAGTLKQFSKGGKAVAQQDYTPEEGEILKRYFK